MRTNLNDLVDAFFKGVIVVILSAVITVLWVLARPVRSVVSLQRGLRRKDGVQIAPRVFLFLAFASLILGPFFYASVMPNGLFVAHAAIQGDPASTAPAKALALATAASSGPYFAAALLATFAGLALAQYLLTWIGYAAFRAGPRRKVFTRAMLYVIGTEVAVMSIFVAAAWAMNLPIIPDAQILLEWPLYAYYIVTNTSDSWFFDVTLAQRILVAIFLVAELCLAFLPIGAVRLLVNHANARRRFPRRLSIIVLTIMLPLITFYSTQVVTALYNSIRSYADDNPPALLNISLTSCLGQDLDTASPSALVTFVVTNMSTQGQLIKSEDFRLESPTSGLQPTHRDRTWEAFATMQVAERNELPLVLRPHDAVLVRATAPLTAADVNFIRTEDFPPDCDLSFDETDEPPAKWATVD